MSSFILFGILLIISHCFTGYVAWHEGYLRGWNDYKHDIVDGFASNAENPDR